MSTPQTVTVEAEHAGLRLDKFLSLRLPEISRSRLQNLVEAGAVAMQGAGAAAVPDDLDPDKLMRPAASRDSKFFWDGVDAHELRIQKRADGTLQHPPVPAIWADKSAAPEYVVAAGTGSVFSFVVHHAPKVPGRTLPFVIALVELDEGVRMLGELRGVDPTAVEIGMPVRATYIDMPESATGPAWTLYAWEPA